MAHTPITGYRELSDEELADINMLKKIEKDVLAEIADLQSTNKYTQRWLAIATTHIQQGFMAANRAIARPNDEHG